MPFKSKAQQRYLYAQEPKVAKRFAKDTPASTYKNMPDRVGKKRKKRFSDIAKGLGKY
jgi:hypothetical protein